MRVQRFASPADIDAAHPTIEEREEYEEPVGMGMVVFAGVDYAAVLAQAEEEADVVIWDGGNNDLPFFAPDLHVVVVDPLRPGHELLYHPGEANLRIADVIVVNKVDSADHNAVGHVAANATSVNPTAQILWAASPVTLEHGPSLVGQRVLVVEDGPTITHGEMPYGAGTVAAWQAGATTLVDPRRWAVRSIAATYELVEVGGAKLPGCSPSSNGYEASLVGAKGEIKARLDALAFCNQNSSYEPPCRGVMENGRHRDWDRRGWHRECQCA